MFKKGQRVYCVVGKEQNMTISIPARFLRYRGALAVCKDSGGNLFKLPKEKVYASQEAMEASIPHLVSSTNLETGRVTEFPLDPRLTNDGERLWERRTVEEPSAFGDRVPDWMEVPVEILEYSPGSKKRRVLRQFQHPCPFTGKPVVCRELEGGVYGFLTEKGYTFTMRLDPPKDGWQFMQGTDC